MINDLGKAKLKTAGTCTAGDYTTVIYHYTTGHPIDDSGYLMIAFRFAGDFGIPQWGDPDAPNYCSIETTGDCRLEPRWDPKGNTRPWGRVLLLKVGGGFLDRGDEVTVVFGDRRGKSPGWQMQTFCEKTFEFKTLVDPIATYQFKELRRSPVIRIIPGKPVRTVCLAPSRVGTGKSFGYRVKQEDRWGNPVARPRWRRHRGFRKPGVKRLRVAGLPGEGSVSSNPVEVVDEPLHSGRYWGDLHGQSEETVGTNSIKDYFLFARDYGCLDVAAHQGNDFQMSDAFWKYLNELTSSLNNPGKFVTFPGYEWSGNTPLGGDRNVWFSGEGGGIYRSSLELVEGGVSKWEVAPAAKDLFRLLKSRKRPRPFCCAHVGGRYADLRCHDPQLEHAVEVHSAWGTFEWMIEEAFDRGYRVGISANSDGHKGRPGASYPGAGKFGSLGGLTCLIAGSLDRKSLLEAIEARHFYATTGNRPLLTVELYRESERIGMMGDILESGFEGAELRVAVEGTSPLERVEVWNGKSLLAERPAESEDPSPGRRFKILWGGAEVKGRGRLVSWDGTLDLEKNNIAHVASINFLNANHPLKQETKSRLSWISNTTGGHAGMILTLEQNLRGTMLMKTRQKNIRYSIPARVPKPRRWQCGGLKKQIEILPLPAEPGRRELKFSLPLEALRKGDNPIYVKVHQEDGHLAWSSPIYLVC